MVCQSLSKNEFHTDICVYEKVVQRAEPPFLMLMHVDWMDEAGEKTGGTELYWLSRKRMWKEPLVTLFTDLTNSLSPPDKTHSQEL